VTDIELQTTQQARSTVPAPIQNQKIKGKQGSSICSAQIQKNISKIPDKSSCICSNTSKIPENYQNPEPK
jgi:hypothetical protein